jgi:hypothetical protein
MKRKKSPNETAYLNDLDSGHRTDLLGKYCVYAGGRYLFNAPGQRDVVETMRDEHPDIDNYLVVLYGKRGLFERRGSASLDPDLESFLAQVPTAGLEHPKVESVDPLEIGLRLVFGND